jgi:hypothetical protein
MLPRTTTDLAHYYRLGAPLLALLGNTVLRAAMTSCPARFATASTTW